VQAEKHRKNLYRYPQGVEKSVDKYRNLLQNSVFLLNALALW
jgi:hypothetical protein